MDHDSNSVTDVHFLRTSWTTATVHVLLRCSVPGRDGSMHHAIQSELLQTVHGVNSDTHSNSCGQSVREHSRRDPGSPTLRVRLRCEYAGLDLKAFVYNLLTQLACSDSMTAWRLSAFGPFPSLGMRATNKPQRRPRLCFSKKVVLAPALVHRFPFTFRSLPCG